MTTNVSDGMFNLLMSLAVMWFFGGWMPILYLLLNHHHTLFLAIPAAVCVGAWALSWLILAFFQEPAE